jgi:AcrR family transcriptional regulator
VASRAQGRETRQRLIQAATESFVKLGYEPTSLNAVAKSAGVTRQALLHYFPSKAELLSAVLDQAERDFRQHGWESETANVGFADGLVAILERNRQEAGLSSLYAVAVVAGVHEGGALHDFVRERERRVHRDMRAAVEHEQAAGRLRTDMDADTLATALRAVFNGLVIQGLLEPDADLSAPLADVLRALVP